MRYTKITAAKFTRLVLTKLDSSLYEAGSQRSKPPKKTNAYALNTTLNTLNAYLFIMCGIVQLFVV